MIENKQNIKITKTEIYPSIYSYRLPDGWHFESFGNNYGNVVFGAESLDNPYIVKKDEDTTNNITITNTKQDNG
ncbi:MAG: hypothetical protein J6Y78_01745 [Paludibacteraceae bacterium]|nr:hypothetical protein [Paludibacteraceae bacterium]